jgi:hypothetical protein
MAECTSKEKWRVGDEPSLLQNSKPHVIALSSVEKSSPAVIASSLDGQLEPSSISATISLENSILEGEERSLTIIGEVNPALPGREITMYVGRDGLAYEKYQSVSDEKGNYSFTWNFTLAGKYSITTSVGGTFVYAGSDSEKLTVFAGVYEPILEEYLPSGDPTVPIGSLVGQGPKYVLKGNVSGTGLSLSGDFMVISESDSGALIIEVRIPRTERAMYFPRTRQTLRVVINEEQIISVPIENNQLGFILRQNGNEDYSASVGVLEDQQISQIAKVLRENHAAYMNASDVATRNKWYKVEATISKNATNAKLYEMNNTLLQNIAVPDSQANGEMGILMSYPPNSILVFRNLKVTSLDQKAAPLPSERERSQADEIQSLAPYVAGAAFIAAIAVVASYVRRRKVTQNIGS